MSHAKGGKFLWSDQLQSAFDATKQAVASVALLPRVPGPSYTTTSSSLEYPLTSHLIGDHNLPRLYGQPCGRYWVHSCTTPMPTKWHCWATAQAVIEGRCSRALSDLITCGARDQSSIYSPKPRGYFRDPTEMILANLLSKVGLYPAFVREKVKLGL